MSENPLSKKLHLNDPNYFSYFKAQKDGWIYDEFCNLWKDFIMKDFNDTTHYNALQVFKLMTKKRSKYIDEIIRISTLSKEKEKRIEILEKEKLVATQNITEDKDEITKLRVEIQELKSLWAYEETKDNGEVAELKKHNKEMESEIKVLNDFIQKWSDYINSVETEVQENHKKLKKADEEITLLKDGKEKFKADLNGANDSIKQVQTLNDKLHYEIAELKKSVETKDLGLQNVKIQFESAEKEVLECKEKCQKLAEIQQALTSLRNQNEELQDELIAAKIGMNKIKENKTLVLKELVQSANICVKSLKNLAPKPAKAIATEKEAEKVKVLEKENQVLVNENETFKNLAKQLKEDFENVCEENQKLKIDLEAAKKRRVREDYAYERRKRSKENQELQNGGEKKARPDMNAAVFIPTKNQQHDSLSSSSVPSGFPHEIYPSLLNRSTRTNLNQNVTPQQRQNVLQMQQRRQTLNDENPLNSTMQPIIINNFYH